MNKAYLSSLLFAVLTGLSALSPAAEVVAETPKPGLAQPAGASGQAQAGKVNLNSADAATLERELVGIGEAKAQAIVVHRETVGAFSSVDELLEVKGIGAAILEKNRDRLSVD